MKRSPIKRKSRMQRQRNSARRTAAIKQAEAYRRRSLQRNTPRMAGRSRRWRAIFRRAARANDGLCRVGDCTNQATQGHHILMRSRGGKDVYSNCLPVCCGCHQWIHDNPAEAARLGYLISGHAPVEMAVA